MNKKNTFVKFFKSKRPNRQIGLETWFDTSLFAFPGFNINTSLLSDVSKVI